MVSGPTTGATEISRTWASRPALAMLVRIAVFLAPILAGWLAVKFTSGLYLRPPGWFGIATWVVQAIVVASSAAHLMKSWAQRFAPMSALLNMTMVFPDRAPSRFGVALRAGNIKRLTTEQIVLSNDRQEAAEQAVALVTELGRHEPRTRGHTERVRTYAELIGQEMGLDDDELNRLRWGVLLHDVGKLTVPAHILNSTGKPTEDEWLILKRHPVEGQKILKPLHDWLGEWAYVSLHHHERWDGGGYPVGLKGEEISRGGRIAAVADTFDVITSKRTYKEAMSFDAAREELVRCSGSQFEPAVVRAFLRIGLDDRRRSLGFLGWLFELPSLVRVTGSMASAAPTTVSTAATAATAFSVSVASLASGGAVEAPSSIAFAEPMVEVVETEPKMSDDDDLVVAVIDGADATSTTSTAQIIVPSSVVSTTTTAMTVPPTITTAPVVTTAPIASTPTTTTPAPTSSTTLEPPVAQADTQLMGTRKNRNIKVLDNDIEGGSALDESTLRIVVPPSHAIEYRVHDDHMHYRSGEDELTDTLVYEICNLAGACTQASVTITVSDA